MAVAKKVQGATWSAVLGGSLSTIGIWILTDSQFEYKYVIPQEIAGAIQTAVTALFAFVGGWFVSEPNA